MEDFIWTTTHYHPTNEFTMDEYLENYLPDEFECFFQDGTYAEIQSKITGKICGFLAVNSNRSNVFVLFVGG